MDENNKLEFDIAGFVSQMVDAQFNTLMLDAAKDNPLLTAMIKLLNEYGIYGVKAHEFMMKLLTLISMVGGEGGASDDQT